MAGPKYPSQMADQFQVRFSGDLHARVKASARQHRRSMNADILARIEASFGPSPVIESGQSFSLDAEVAAAIERHVKAEVAARLQRIAGALNAGGE